MNKKIFTTFLVSILVLSVIQFSFVPEVFAAVEDSFYENFENWNINSWTNYTAGAGSYIDIPSEAAAYAGDYGFNMTCGEFATSAAFIIQTFSSVGNVSGLYFDFYPVSESFGIGGEYCLVGRIVMKKIPGQYYPYGGIGIYSPDGDDFYWRVVFSDGDGGWFTDEGSTPISFDDEWHSISLIMDAENGFINGTIDGVLECQLTETFLGDPEFIQVEVGGWNTGYQAGLNGFYDEIYYCGSTPGLSISADLEDVDDDGADWVFTDWKYYTFNVSVACYYHLFVENVSMMFVVPTGEENIACEFWSDGDDWVYSSNMTYESREGEPCILKAGSWTSGEYLTSATFDIWFSSRILDVWDPADGVDVYGDYDDDGWTLENQNYFRIYSKGGFEMNYAATGAAGKLAGGTPFSLYANNGSIVYNEIWYRDGQHIKLMPDIHFLTGLDPFYIRYGIDYSVGDGEWLEGWNLYINPKFVSYTGVFAANVWINMTNLFNNRGQNINSRDLYMFYHGSVSGEGDSGHWKSWIDLWFSDKNGSRVGAGRYNAYEYPMIDSADLWLRWLANNWGVKDNVLKEMSMEAPLLDTDNSTVISSESIKMMRFWCELEIDDADGGQYVSIDNYEAFDVTHSRELPLLGMSNPIFDETLIPTVGQRGILGALWSLFAGMGQWLSENVLFGGLNLWSTFVGFLDTVAAMFGAPKLFTNLFSWMAELIVYLVESAGYIGTIASSIFSLVGALLGTFLTVMGDLVTSLVNTLTIFTDMMGGAYGAGVDMWDALGISSWITVAMVFYPIYLLILWEEKGMDAVLQQLGWIFGILSWLFGFFVTLIQFTIGLITAVIESIPVAE